MTTTVTEDTCPFCGATLPAPTAGACSKCPLSTGCSREVVCCARCGYTAPTPESSTLVRLFDILFGAPRARSA
ncbi:MAG TPA: hypothetical protein VHF22_05810 [Planctomycetota bacterium]|nr:hypothetical protein [Planctomycetota bacterium]